MPLRLPVLQLGEVSADVDAAARWLSGFGAAPVEVAPLRLPPREDIRRYAALGGMADGPFGSRGLARAVLGGLSPEQADFAAAERVVLITPPGFHPHTWGPDRGGVHLGRGRWVKRYAILPDGAPPGHVAHELGHLLHHWPDLHTVSGLGCLMARGGDHERGWDPLPPCAALRVAEGWEEPAPLQEFAGRGCFRVEAGGLVVVGEVRGGVHLQWTDGRGLPYRAATVAEGPALQGIVDGVLLRWLAEARRRVEAAAAAGRTSGSGG